MPRTCPDCSTPCVGARCRSCHLKHISKTARTTNRKCANCGSGLHRQSKGELCQPCRHARLARVLVEEANVAPSLLPIPKKYGDWMVITDPHIPFHDPQVILKACEASHLLGIRKLAVAGDLIHADIISKYENAGKQVTIIDELNSCARVLHVLSDLFDEIFVIVGNHDQRLEKLCAKSMKSAEGKHSMEVLARILQVPDNAEGISYGILEHFFGSDKVKLHPLPDMLINDAWLVIHPGSCSRVSPQTERKLAIKWRKSVIGGHNHLFGVGFADDGVEVAANIGHACNDTKFRYVREKPSHFPRTVPGFCAILTDDDAPQGRILPMAVHDRWFDLAKLAERLKGE